MSLLNSFFRLPGRRENSRSCAHSAPPTTDLASTVRRERALADRLGGEFSLILFQQDGRRGRDRLTHIERHLSQRARIIDQYYRLADGRLCLIMPGCPAAAAGSLARSLCGRFSTPQFVIGHDLYHYKPGSSVDWPDEPTVRNVPRDRGDNDNRSWPLEDLVVRATPIWKRALDLFVAGACLLALAPFMLVVGVLIKLTSQGPILFAQTRTGRSGKPFRMFKFRTMVVDAEERKAELLSVNEQDGPAFKMKNDPRVTPLGRFLRATSVDELPQLWNVLRGQMSLVGPRPLPVSESARCEPWQQERLDVTPGLTCGWQISARRTQLPFADWMRMDIQYARARSLAADVLLIVQTFLFMVRRRGM
jgi:lipopolysaccharide/colanic/teichoic acid biosynthesis glycosyltransferase